MSNFDHLSQIQIKSNTNRFADNEDLSVDDCDLKQLMAECEKWSHKNDLQLLSHLKQMSSNLINKTENTNQSIDSLVFETKMNCVKVDNVINEFQMLANSQFVENRVYDEEVEDIITSGQNLPNEEIVSNKNKEEEILNKIKVALNIGLNFMNQRFDCVSNIVPQNDSDDENDQILEGLISNTARDEYSQRPLPYIIGSEDFIKDNYVGLSYVEESPAIDLQTKDFSVKSVDSFESKSETNVVTNSSNTNNFINDLNDSEEESNDLFGTIHKIEESKDLFGDNSKNDNSDDLFGIIPQNERNNEKSETISEESDSDPFISEDKEIGAQQTNDSKPLKPSMPSFHDELSAAILSKNPNNSSVNKKSVESETKETKPRIQRVPTLESESSDENDSIFTKSSLKSEDKQKNNFSNLFGDEPNEEVFAQKTKKQTSDKQINKVLPNSKTISEKTSNLFDDDDDDEDIFAFSKKTIKPVLTQESKEKEVSNSYTQNKSDSKKPLVSKTSLFSDDDDDDDLFSAISSKPKSKTIVVQNSDAFESVVKPKESSAKRSKPTDNLMGELSAALKKKQLFQSDDEKSDSDSNDDFSEKKETKIIKENSPQISSEEAINSNKSSEVKESNESLFNDNNIKTEKMSSEIESNEVSVSKPSNDFYSEEPTLTLANDVLKHRAALGAQRNRRRPTKKLHKLTPITDFDQNYENDSKISPNTNESPPVAAVRTVKTVVSKAMSDEVAEYEKSDEMTDKSMKSLSSLIKSPSTEEDDIFPTQTNASKNQNISKIFEKSEKSSVPFLDDSGDNDESLFSSKKSTKNVSKKTVDSRGLFDTSDSDDDNFFSNKSQNVISNIIKPSNSELFNDVSSTDSSLSNKSDFKIGNSKPAVSLFSDSEDDDLFSAVTKTKSVDKKPEIQVINRTDKSDKIPEKTPRNEDMKKTNSLFSDNEEENTDLFQNKDIKQKVKTNVKPIFDFDDDDEDIFAPKSSTTKTTIVPKNKPRKESQSSDLFDDPLFASRS